MPPNNAHTSEEEGGGGSEGPRRARLPTTDRPTADHLGIFLCLCPLLEKKKTAHHVFAGGIDDKYPHPNEDTMHSGRGRGLTMIAEGLVTITKGGWVWSFVFQRKMSGDERVRRKFWRVVVSLRR